MRYVEVCKHTGIRRELTREQAHQRIAGFYRAKEARQLALKRLHTTGEWEGTHQWVRSWRDVPYVKSNL